MGTGQWDGAPEEATVYLNTLWEDKPKGAASVGQVLSPSPVLGRRRPVSECGDPQPLPDPGPVGGSGKVQGPVENWGTAPPALFHPFHCSFLFFKILIVIFRERGREGEKHQCERGTGISCISQAPHLGTEPATWAHALARIQTGDPPLCGTMPNPLSHMGQGQPFLFIYSLCSMQINSVP